MTSDDHFPWLHDVAQQYTIVYFYISLLETHQAIHPIYYIALAKMDCQPTSEMSLVKSLKWLRYPSVKKFHDPLIGGIPWLSMTTVIFHDFPGLEKSFLKFHDFPECVGTGNPVLKKMCNAPCSCSTYTWQCLLLILVLLVSSINH